MMIGPLMILLAGVGIGLFGLLSRSFMIRTLDAMGLVRNPRSAWIAATIVAWFAILFAVFLAVFALVSS